ncbi:MAG: ATP-binding protein [Thermodesulfobacteriota bacterium]|nr:ATP-binding protein [Thermodesulfobacteriota bacterium]
MDFEFYGIIPSSSKLFLDKDYNSTDLFFSISINIIAFYLVAYLSSLLSKEVLISRKELKKKQLDFNQLEALNRNIVMSINSGLLTTDIKGRITFFNKAAEEITGYGFSDVHNTFAEDLFPFLRDKKDWTTEKLANNMHSLRYESKFKKQNGDILYLGFSISLLKDTMGEDIGKIIIFQNLTMFKEMEDHIKRVDRLAAVGRLSAGIAHEMRNPLASASGSIEVLNQELQLNGQHKRLMNIAINEIDRLNSLITDFMLFAQPGLGKKEDVVITKVIGDTLNEITNCPEWNKNNIEVRWDLSSHNTVKADPKQLRHVFWNIFTNAVQAMPEGGELQIKVRDLVSPNNTFEKMTESLEINITDTGCGIPEENLDSIFDPFFTTKDKGTGMGLAIAYRIIESYYGKIVVKSELQRGTSFCILLPIASL